VPARRRAPEAVEQPGFLRGAENGSAGIPPLRTPAIGLKVPAAVVGRPRAGFARAILAPVERRELHQVSEAEPVVQPERGALGPGPARSERHVLVEGLIRGGPPGAEARRILERCRPLRG